VELIDSVAIITGSSSGIGAAIAKGLSEKGCHVVINYNENETSARTVADQCRASGVQVLVQQANVSVDADCQTLVAATIKKFGRFNILINNAGITKFCEHKQLSGLDKQDFLNLYATNTVGPFQMVRAAETYLRQQPIAHIINMASIAGITGVGSSIAYAASKGALVTLTMSLARVLGPQIRINAICPGFVQGEWLEKGLGKENYAKMLSGLRKVTPLGDTATPERIAQAAVGIITGMDWTTGETFIIDGGTHLQTTPLRR
jgi:3-oxoacyl-[acyl-carrier protein] reductase